MVAVARLEGRHADGLRMLDALSSRLEGTALCEAIRERGRALRASGRMEEARDVLREAVRGFEEAGERWDAEATRRELDLAG
jgi:predicted RNA polymerase sigma factor